MLLQVCLGHLANGIPHWPRSIYVSQDDEGRQEATGQKYALILWASSKKFSDQSIFY